MSIGTSQGARFYIGPVSSATDITDLAALSYTEVGKVETLGEIGPNAQDVTFVPLADGDVQHLKGAIDNGATTVTCARDPLDAGQLALSAAMATKFEYAAKIVLADAADANDTDTVIYVRGPVLNARRNVGGANDVTKINFAIANNVYLEDASEAVA